MSQLIHDIVDSLRDCLVQLEAAYPWAADGDPCLTSDLDSSGTCAACQDHGCIDAKIRRARRLLIAADRA